QRYEMLFQALLCALIFDLWIGFGRIDDDRLATSVEGRSKASAICRRGFAILSYRRRPVSLFFQGRCQSHADFGVLRREKGSLAKFGNGGFQIAGPLKSST